MFKRPSIKAWLTRLADRTKSGTSAFITVTKGRALDTSERTSRAAKAAEALPDALGGTTRRFVEKAAGSLGDIADTLRQQATSRGEPEGRFAGQLRKQQLNLSEGLGAVSRAVARPPIQKTMEGAGHIVGGLVSGLAGIASGTLDAVAPHDEEMNALWAEARTQALTYELEGRAFGEALRGAAKKGDKDRLFDLLTVGGISVAGLLEARTLPAELERAYALAYPALAQEKSLFDVLWNAQPGELTGVLAGIKGKLFELKLVDQLNEALPAGAHAELAKSATQAGWDIVVRGPHGEVLELLQAKATESADYVAQALQRYPDIDVLTTSEVHSELFLRGLAEHAHDSGVSLDQLNSTVLDATTHAQTLTPSANTQLLGLAVIGLFTFSRKGDLKELCGQFGEKAAQSKVAVAAGATVAAFTHVWWLAPAASVGARYLWGVGWERRERLEQLRALVSNGRRVIASRHARLPASLKPRLAS